MEWYQLRKPAQIQAMSFRTGSKKEEMNINIRINSTSGIDLLGLAIDDELKLTQHINNICIKGARKLGVQTRF